METFKIMGCNRKNMFTRVPLRFILSSDHEIGLHRLFISVHGVHITTAIVIKIKGSTEMAMRLAYTGLILSLSTIQSRFKAISVDEPTASVDS